MRKINYIIVHSSATKPTMDIGVKEIRQWHLDRGWRDIGYHYVIRRDGKIEKGRQDYEVGAHVAGHNKYSIGICVVGGIDDDGKSEFNFTNEQMESLKNLVDELLKDYPDAEVWGHRDMPGTRTVCPGFDVAMWYAGTKDEINK